jgi:hypothetical protein
MHGGSSPQVKNNFLYSFLQERGGERDRNYALYNCKCHGCVMLATWRCCFMGMRSLLHMVAGTLPNGMLPHEHIQALLMVCLLPHARSLIRVC